MVNKISLLQKNILTTIYLNGEFVENVNIYDLDSTKVDINYQLERRKLVKERQGKFIGEKIEHDGVKTRMFEVPSYMLSRSRLACTLFRWEFDSIQNLAAATLAHPKSKPANYSSRQVALSNSLKSLKLKGLVEFQNFYGGSLSSSLEKNARIIYLTSEGIKKAQGILTIKSKKSKMNLTVRS